MFKQDPTDLKPCPHMETLVSAWLDGALNGPLRWYTRWHVSQCPRCTAAVPVLDTLRARLRGIAELPPDPAPLTPERRAAVVAGWESADQATGGAAPTDS